MTVQHPVRSFVTSHSDPPLPSSPSSSPSPVSASHGDQRRAAVTVADLDRQRDERERIVILGSGWAGYPLARNLDHKKFQVIIVSPRSYFVFTPLLASTSVGTLEFRTALEPIRNRRCKALYIQGWADDVDLYNKSITIEEAVVDPNTSLAPTGCRNEGKDDQQIAHEKKSKTQGGQMFDLQYDKLIIGVGAYSQTFKTPGVREHAHFLKDVGDARKIRKRLLECFETAALPTTPDHIRKQLLHFAIVGGGPTGVEFSAELHDLVHQDLFRIYPELLPHVRISLFEIAPKMLGAFDEKLAAYAMQAFQRSGIVVHTSKKIHSLSPGLPVPSDSTSHASSALGLTFRVEGEEEQGIGMCVWSTGLMPNPFIAKALSATRRFPPNEVILSDNYAGAGDVQWSIARDARTGSILTNDRLRLIIEAPLPAGSEATLPNSLSPGDPSKMSARLKDVFAMGDCAAVQHTNYPATAQVANQKAEWLAKRLNAGDLDAATSASKFTYKSLGVMAYLGDARAIVEGLGGLKKTDLSGRAAWLVWRGAYLVRSISWRNRVLIPVYWCLTWMFGRDISRF